MRRVERPLPLRAPRPLAAVFERFRNSQASEGVVLLAAIVVALVWANLPGNHSYDAFWSAHISLSFGDLHTGFTLRELVDEGLMTFFFLFVALEIKREILVGELASVKRASLALFAALGGMAVPALIYLLVNLGGETQGWAIPIATDIALVSGVMSLLRRGLPLSLQVFMLALAIVDDIVAILVIAVYYTGSLSVLPLVAVVAVAALLVFANVLGVRHVWVYGVLGVFLWLALLLGGLRGTLAGVVLALAIPARSRVSTGQFVASGRRLLDRFEEISRTESCVLCTEEMGELARDIKRSSAHVRPPLSLLEDALHYWVAFFVMPVFALSHGGIRLNTGLLRELGRPVVLGVMLGLFVGKPLGIFLASRLAVLAHLSRRPERVSWLKLFSAGWLGGIGFTVAIFIAGLAFKDHPLLPAITAGILVASLASALGGWLMVRLASRPPGRAAPAARPKRGARTARAVRAE